MGISSSNMVNLNNNNDIEDTDEELEGHFGYRIMKVFPEGPGARTGLRPYEDFIVAIDELIVEEEEERIADYLKQVEQVQLTIWNCIEETERQVSAKVSFSKEWGHLGVIVRYESLFQACEFVWHVITVIPNSTADEAGLVPDMDYIVGTPSVAFRSFDTLLQLVRDAAYLQHDLDLMVWSAATGRVRIVHVEPDVTVDGTPFLGCEVAKGILHGIPSRKVYAEEMYSVNKTGREASVRVTNETLKPPMSFACPNRIQNENDAENRTLSLSTSVDTLGEEFYDTRSPSSIEFHSIENIKSQMDSSEGGKKQGETLK
eukprot:jgi/Galph1/5319/GphlegSOOS_G3999.1